MSNTMKIMTTEMTKQGTPKSVLEGLEKRKAQMAAKCIETFKLMPAGAAMLDCMIAAKDTNDIRSCQMKQAGARPTPARTALPALKGIDPATAAEVLKAVKAVKRGLAIPAAPTAAPAAPAAK
jgi:hypothetical protein